MSNAAATTVELTPLVTADRCDTGACNAQALVRLWIDIPERNVLLPLDFCGHHYALHHTPLVQGVIVTTEDNRE